MRIEIKGTKKTVSNNKLIDYPIQSITISTENHNNTNSLKEPLIKKIILALKIRTGNNYKQQIIDMINIYNEISTVDGNIPTFDFILNKFTLQISGDIKEALSYCE